MHWTNRWAFRKRPGGRARACRRRIDATSLPQESPHIVFSQLPTKLGDRILDFLPRNEITTTIRALCRATRAQFGTHTTVLLSQPTPTWAFADHWSAPDVCLILNRRQREKLLCLTAASGVVANMEVAGTATGLVPGFAALAAAARANQWTMCEWLLASVPWSSSAVLAAFSGGHVQLAKWLLAVRPEGTAAPWPGDTLMAVVEGCPLLELQQQVERLGVNVSQLPQLMGAAVSSLTPDWMDKVGWLLAEPQACPLKETEVCWVAATCIDAISRLIWLEQRGFTAWRTALYAAAFAGDVITVQWLLLRGEQPTSAVVQLAARAGRLETLKALHAAGALVNPLPAMEAAAEGGHLHVARWLEATFGAAALQLHKLDFLHGLAAGSDMMIWLLERGCPMTMSAVSWNMAVFSGCVATLDWLADADCPLPVSGRDGAAGRLGKTGLEGEARGGERRVGRKGARGEARVGEPGKGKAGRVWAILILPLKCCYADHRRALPRIRPTRGPGHNGGAQPPRPPLQPRGGRATL